MFMPKRPISVTLSVDNLTWLRARVTSGKRRSLSEALDDLVSSARASADGNTVRSVAGTIDISAIDPGLERADEFVRSQFSASLLQPMTVHEERSVYRPSTKASRRARASSARRRA